MSQGGAEKAALGRGGRLPGSGSGAETGAGAWTPSLPARPGPDVGIWGLVPQELVDALWL